MKDGASIQHEAKKRPAAASPRGVAMLLVLIGLAVLGLVANEVQYNSVVELRLATNQRDEMRAYFLARSGISLSRLLLRFQRQMDKIQIPNLGNLLQQFLGNTQTTALTAALGGNAGALGALAGGAAGGQNAATTPSSMNIQLWRMAKIDCHMLELMVPAMNAEDDAPSQNPKFSFDEENAVQQEKRFGSFSGCFDTIITDEEERINLNKLDAPQITARILLAQLVSSLGDKKYEFLFEEEDSNRVRVVPNDIIIALRDWVDENDTSSTLNFSAQGKPFLNGFSDENGNYVRYEPPYRAKNARFDSLDELYMVHGINDAFMAAFKDRLTVYPDVNSRLNINTDDPFLLELAIRSMTNQSVVDPRLQDPIFIDTLIQKIRAARMFSVFGMSVSDFANLLKASGVAVNPRILNNVQNQRFVGDKSTTYRIEVTGEAGAVRRTITAVLRLNERLGRLLYWREG